MSSGVGSGGWWLGGGQGTELLKECAHKVATYYCINTNCFGAKKKSKLKNVKSKVKK